MADGAPNIQQEARAEAYAADLATLDMSLAERFREERHWPFFERLRNEAPVHRCPESEFGPYWSITRYADIMTVDTNHGVFSSEGGITIFDEKDDFRLPMFIAMDPPKHDEQRKAVSPIVSPHNLLSLEPVIRQRAQAIFDGLPIGERFDWVDRVSIELTTQMLATLFDFPWEDRRKLTRWSDVATATPETGIIESDEAGQAELLECAAYFTRLWNERVNAEPRNDLISMMAHAEATRHMGPEEFLGNLILLIVGGNDTTRNSISGGLYALNKFPREYGKLRVKPDLLPSMIPEIIRWQTPLAHMRRIAKEDFVLEGQTIRAGDKVVMWYVSGNRDERAIESPDDFIIDRPRPRQHLAFGFGIHRCVGNRLAEMQLRIVWEEILKRWDRIELVDEPERTLSSFIKGYVHLPVLIPRDARPVVSA
ncbi:MAG: cytochrome P450 [Caulobacteraceae bacterium]